MAHNGREAPGQWDEIGPLKQAGPAVLDASGKGSIAMVAIEGENYL